MNSQRIILIMNHFSAINTVLTGAIRTSKHIFTIIINLFDTLSSLTNNITFTTLVIAFGIIVIAIIITSVDFATLIRLCVGSYFQNTDSCITASYS